MAQPTSSMTHIDGPLTNISVAYLQAQSHFIADQVFPMIPVAKQSDKYFVFDRTTFMRDSMQKRAGGEESAGGGYTLSSDSYYCDVFGLHKDISDFDRANTDSPLNQDRNAVQYITQQALIRKEKQWQSSFFTTGVWGTDNTSATDWDDYASSDPLGDIETAKRAILVATGQEANTLVLGYDVFVKAKNHPDIVDRIKYTSSRVVTEDVLASLFGVQRVLVPRAVVDSVSEGKTPAPALIHGKHALLLHVAQAPGLEVPSAGYTFTWAGLAPGYNGQGLVMNKFRMQHLMSDRIEGHLAFAQKVVGSQLGYFFQNVVG